MSFSIICNSWTWFITGLLSTILKSKKRATTNFFVPASSVLYFFSKDSHNSLEVLIL
ncbi:hypothetical protein HanIR_Chr17g0860481 [Helianthus annuus]|nr:hypothetical protein HanIR_Chr17g0860481 [Helianthus annuus]